MGKTTSFLAGLLTGFLIFYGFYFLKEKVIYPEIEEEEKIKEKNQISMYLRCLIEEEKSFDQCSYLILNITFWEKEKLIAFGKLFTNLAKTYRELLDLANSINWSEKPELIASKIAEIRRKSSEIEDFISSLKNLISLLQNFGVDISDYLTKIETEKEKVESICNNSFPSLIIERIEIINILPLAYYHLDWAAPAKVYLRNPFNESLNLDIKLIIGDWSSEVKTILYPNSKQNITLKPKISIKEPRLEQALIEIRIDKRLIYTQQVPIKIYPKDYFIALERIGNRSLNFSLLPAVFVMPNSKEVLEFISSISKKENIDFVGYQRGEAEVKKQIEAIWNNFREDIHYLSPPVTFLEQRVRLPPEVLSRKMGNCFDLSITFASILEAIGIKPGVAIIPNHAFPCYFLDQDKKKIECIEVTAFSSSYEEALKIGMEKFEENKEKLYNNVLEDGFFCDIDSARKEGIYPIS